MVLLHVKRGEKESFLFETSAASEVDVVLREVVKIQNLRMKVGRLTSAAEGLAQHGPMKPPEQQGLEDDTPLLEDYDVSSGSVAPREAPQRTQNYRQDPTERRTGNAPPDDIGAVITRTVADASALISEKQVQMKVHATAKALEDAINNVRGAVMIAFPMGLPDYDTVRMILEDREQLEGGAASLEVLDADSTSLWCFNKELQREKLLSDYTGKNEKTKVRHLLETGKLKRGPCHTLLAGEETSSEPTRARVPLRSQVVAKLQKRGAGAPQREPVVSEDEQKAMIAFYHKKQQEAEKMAVEDEDAYLHSSWANPKSLKSAFTGVGEVTWKAGGLKL